MENHSNRLNALEIKGLANSLREIEPKFVKQPTQDGRRRVWYQGEEPYFDIFFELENEAIAWFQFTLRGKSASWDKRRQTWQTGVTNELKLDDVSFYAASKTIEASEQVDEEFLALMKSILLTRDHEPIFAQVLELLDG